MKEKPEKNILFGFQLQKQFLKSILESKPLNKRLLEQLELPDTRFIIVAGPPFSGKTSLLRTVLSEKKAIIYNLKIPELLEDYDSISALRSSLVNVIEILRQEIEKNTEKEQLTVVLLENLLVQVGSTLEKNPNKAFAINELINELEELSRETDSLLIITTRNYPGLSSMFSLPSHHLVVIDYPDKETMKSFIQSVVSQVNSITVTPIEIDENKVAEIATSTKTTIGEMKYLLGKIILAHSSIPEYHLETEDLIKEINALFNQKQKLAVSMKGLRENTTESETVEDIMNRLMQKYREIEETQEIDMSVESEGGESTD